MSKPTNGLKINDSRYVYQACRFVYEGNSDNSVARMLRDRYGFEVSVPCVNAFRHTFYPERLKEMVEFSESFQQQQSGRVKTFIDESLEQVKALKSKISEIEKQEAILDKEIAFTSKFDIVFQSAIDKYLAAFDPEHPTKFLENAQSTEEVLIASAIKSMGEENVNALSAYIKSRGPAGLYKLRGYLTEKILDYREAIVKIQRDIFKSYRSYSILQELTLIFEEYNSIIVEEFFADKNKLDRDKYTKVRQRILGLYDKFQIRYQGVEAPDPNVVSAKVESVVADAEAGILPKEVSNDPRLNKNVNTSTTLQLKAERKKQRIRDEFINDAVVSNAVSALSEKQAIDKTGKIFAETQSPKSVEDLAADLNNTIKRPETPFNTTGDELRTTTMFPSHKGISAIEDTDTSDKETAIDSANTPITHSTTTIDSVFGAAEEEETPLYTPEEK